MMVTSFIVGGGFGALVNCALASYFSSQFDHFFPEMFVQPVSAFKTLVPAVFGFFGGTLIVLIWHFLKVRVVRYLFQQNGWFLHPKRPLNKVRLPRLFTRYCPAWSYNCWYPLTR